MLFVARSCACSASIARHFASMPVAVVNGVPIHYKLHEPAASQLPASTASNRTTQSTSASHDSQQAQLPTANAHPLGNSSSVPSCSVSARREVLQSSASALGNSLSGSSNPAGLRETQGLRASPAPLGNAENDATSPVITKQGSPPRVLFICGLDARHDTEYYRHLIAHMVGQRCAVCSFDNRGVGKSHTPQDAAEYSTDLMAGDTLGLMDHLGWRSAHVVGMSMGGMIGTKVMAAAPERVQSLTVLSSTAFGHHMVLSMLWSPILALEGMDIFPLKTRVRANLKSNFSPAFLRERMPSGQTRLRHMRNVIMDAFAALSPEQTQAVKDHQQSPGHKGQLRAVLMHRLEPPQAQAIRAAADVPRQVLSGRHDPIAGRRYARRLAAYLDCKLHITGAAHSGITIESVDDVGAALEEVILGERRTSNDAWAAVAAEARGRAESSAMAREVFTA